jgi:hypothetical protein
MIKGCDSNVKNNGIDQECFSKKKPGKNPGFF